MATAPLTLSLVVTVLVEAMHFQGIVYLLVLLPTSLGLKCWHTGGKTEVGTEVRAFAWTCSYPQGYAVVTSQGAHNVSFVVYQRVQKTIALPRWQSWRRAATWRR